MMGAGSPASPSASTGFPGINEQMLSAVFSRVRSSPYLEHFRSIREFTAQEGFSRPLSYDEVTTRLELNIKYFAANYALVGILLLTYSILSSPTLLIFLIAYFFLYRYLKTAKVIKVGRYEIKGQTRLIGSTVVLCVLFVLVAGSTIVWLIAATALFSMGHAVAHEAMLDADLEANANTTMTGVLSDDDDDVNELLAGSPKEL